MTDLTLHTREDLVVAVPVLLGFVPRDSVVLIVSEAAGRQFHARWDMPTVDTAERLYPSVANACEREGVTRVGLLLYTDSADVVEIADRLVRSFKGIHVFDTLHVTPDWYTSLTIPGDEQHPYDLTTHPLIAEEVLAGRLILQDQEDIRRSLDGIEPSTELVDAYERHANRWRAVKDDEAALKRHYRDEAMFVRTTLTAMLDDRTIDDDTVARLAVALVPLKVRDVAWALINHENARRYMEVFRELTRRIPSPSHAAPAALFAFAAWLAGDGVSARIGVDLALQAEPGYQMAMLVRTALVTTNPATFQPLDIDGLPVWNAA